MTLHINHSQTCDMYPNAKHATPAIHNTHTFNITSIQHTRSTHLIAPINKYPMPEGLEGMGCIYNDPFIYIFGGQNAYDIGNTILSFNITNHKWAASCMVLPESKQYHAVLSEEDLHLFESYGTKHYLIKLNDLIGSYVKYTFLIYGICIFTK